MTEEIQKGTRVLESISNNNSKKITTIKLAENTKNRLDNLRVYQRETYNDILKKMLELLNACRVNPSAAQQRLILLDKERKRNFKEEK